MARDDSDLPFSWSLSLFLGIRGPNAGVNRFVAADPPARVGLLLEVERRPNGSNEHVTQSESAAA